MVSEFETVKQFLGINSRDDAIKLMEIASKDDIAPYQLREMIAKEFNVDANSHVLLYLVPDYESDTLLRFVIYLDETVR